MAIEIFSPNKIVEFNQQDMNIILPLYMEILLLLFFFVKRHFSGFHLGHKNLEGESNPYRVHFGFTWEKKNGI